MNKKKKEKKKEEKDIYEEGLTIERNKLVFKVTWAVNKKAFNEIVNNCFIDV